MLDLSIGDIARITGATPIHDLDVTTRVTGPVEFDSRAITPGGLFLALPGASVDGHDYLAAAAQAGAAVSLVGTDTGEPALLAPDLDDATTAELAAMSNSAAFDSDPDGRGQRVITALSRLARYTTDTLCAGHDGAAGMTVIGVTGSAGKTSTKDLIASVVAADGPTVAPPGSFNNEIGLPYTALRATPETRYLVSEMSARGVGHIRHLTHITPPRIAVVLNVGSAHLGEFGSAEAIATAKGELVEAESVEIAILNADDPQVAAMASRTSGRVLTFSVEGEADNADSANSANNADYIAREVSFSDLAQPRFTLHHPHGPAVEVTLQISGEHSISNALAAAAVGMECGIDPQVVAAALSAHTAVSAHRMDVRQRRRDDVTIINDAYNANPESMRAGIRGLLRITAASRAAHPQARSWAVLGQMGELGDDAAESHRELGRFLVEAGVDRVVTVGNGVNQAALAAVTEEAGVETSQVEDTDAAMNLVDAELRPGDVVLVKASYSEALWNVAAGLMFGEEEG